MKKILLVMMVGLMVFSCKPDKKSQLEKLKKETIVKFSTQTKCHNVTGDYLHNCHEGVMLFDTYDSKNCSYMKDTEKPIDSWDCNNYYYNSLSNN